MLGLSNKKHSFIFLALLISVFYRFYQLGNIPQGFHNDEAAFGYNAYSIMKTGNDEYGERFPLVMRSFNDYKGAIYSYITIPFIYALGLNEMSVRLPSAIFGVFFVIITYLISYLLSKNRDVAIISMFFATISPVGILLSRVQSDPLVSIVFAYLGIYFLLRFFVTSKPFFLLTCLILTILSFYTNTITRVFIVPFIAILLLWYWKSLTVRSRILTIGSIILSIGILVLLSFGVGGARFEQVSIFHKSEVQLLIDEGIREDGVGRVSIFLSRLIHNKLTGYGLYLVKNYSNYLSFKFFYLQSEQPLREAIPNIGIFLIIEFPFLLAGIYASARKKLSYGLLSVMWFFIVPLFISFASEESPNIHRFLLATIPTHLLTSIGVISIYKNIQRNLQPFYICSILILLTLNSAYFAHQLFIHQPVHNPIYRNYQDTLLANRLKQYYDNYDIIVSPKILEQILFFWSVNPLTYQKQGSPRDTDDAWYQKFFFSSDSCPSRLLNPMVRSIKAKRILYIDKGECAIGQNDTIIEEIYYANSLPAYRLVEKQ